ncbi:MAG: D-alanyl-D-alanine carboxypeptidase DacB precursor [Firmicutes bacterium ADurb.Bin182]|nr:MAG: D-alanyl-D-alanine carboxypeptidase DacB precursor [Firmicutes bacterium ADurb.Bin182]
MKKVNLLLTFALFILMAGNVANTAFAYTEPEISAGGAVLMEVETTKVLYALSPHERLPMASTTKIMTALVAIENSEPDDMVEVPDIAFGAEGSSMYLKRGEMLSMEDLLYGLMLTSGNDAAIAIAVHVGGSVEGFAKMMNARAKSIGAFNTNFVNPNGLPDSKHYTTAYDLTLIAAEALKNPEFAKITGTKTYKTKTGDYIRWLKNKNKILSQYDGGTGVKTGYTKQAGKCLVFSAQKGNMHLVGTVLDCGEMFPSAMDLLDFGFNNFSPYTVMSKGDDSLNINVRNGLKNKLALTVKQDIIVPAENGTVPDIDIHIKVNKTVDAPVRKYDRMGALEIYDNGRLLLTVPLYAADDVLQRDYIYYLKRLLNFWAA